MNTEDLEEPKKSRLRKGTLTKERIVDESLTILDRDGFAKFTMVRLGRALGADQTAVYRHFASKDELSLAIAERLYEEAFDGLVQSTDWAATVRDAVMRIRRTFLRHPAAAALISARITNQRAEMTAANTVIGAFLSAGFSASDSALFYRVVVDFALLWNGGEADFMTLPADTRAAEEDRWVRTYRGVSPKEFPHIESVKDELFEISVDDVFGVALDMLIESLERRAALSS